MKNSILIASLFAVALAACGKKEEAPVEPAAPAVVEEQAPAAVEPATEPAATEPAATEPAAAEPAATEPAAAPAEEEKK